jgi:hypothetical protein
LALASEFDVTPEMPFHQAAAPDLVGNSLHRHIIG